MTKVDMDNLMPRFVYAMESYNICINDKNCGDPLKVRCELRGMLSVLEAVNVVYNIEWDYDLRLIKRFYVPMFGVDIEISV